jgi:hypothetical protein
MEDAVVRAVYLPMTAGESIGNRFSSSRTSVSQLSFLLVAVVFASCGLIPERVSADDPRLKPMFEAMTRVDRTRLGFTAVPADAQIRAEWRPRAGYDVMLHIDGKTSRTVAFKRTAQSYEWIGEQEILKGPATYDTPDGRFNESITITFERAPISGFTMNRVNVLYAGEDPALRRVNELTLQDVQPWLKKWGYR